jgi:hypothetical protein
LKKPLPFSFLFFLENTALQKSWSTIKEINNSHANVFKKAHADVCLTNSAIPRDAAVLSFNDAA